MVYDSSFHQKEHGGLCVAKRRDSSAGRHKQKLEQETTEGTHS